MSSKKRKGKGCKVKLLVGGNANNDGVDPMQQWTQQPQQQGRVTEQSLRDELQNLQLGNRTMNRVATHCLGVQARDQTECRHGASPFEGLSLNVKSFMGVFHNTLFHVRKNTRGQFQIVPKLGEIMSFMPPKLAPNRDFRDLLRSFSGIFIIHNPIRIMYKQHFIIYNGIRKGPNLAPFFVFPPFLHNLTRIMCNQNRFTYNTKKFFIVHNLNFVSILYNLTRIMYNLSLIIGLYMIRKNSLLYII